MTPYKTLQLYFIKNLLTVNLLTDDLQVPLRYLK